MTATRAAVSGQEVEGGLWTGPQARATGDHPQKKGPRGLLDGILVPVVGLALGRNFTTPPLEVAEKYPCASALAC